MTEIVLDKKALPKSPPPSTVVEVLEQESSGTMDTWNGNTLSRSVNSVESVLMGMITGCLGTAATMQITQSSAGSSETFAITTLVASAAIGLYSKKNRSYIIRKIYREAFNQEISKPLLKTLVAFQKTLWGEGPVYILRSHLGLENAPIITGEKYAKGLILSSSNVTIMWEKPDSILAWDSALTDTVAAYELDQGRKPSQQKELEASYEGLQKALSALMDGEISAPEYLEVVRASNNLLAKHKM